VAKTEQASWRKTDRRMAIATGLWFPISLLTLFASNKFAHALSNSPQIYDHHSAYWRSSASIWVILCFYAMAGAAPALCYLAMNSIWRFVACNLLITIGLITLSLMTIRSGHAIWDHAVAIRDPAPWVGDRVVTAKQTAGLTTGCFPGTSARNPDRLEFTIRWWSAPGETADYDLAGFDLKAADLPAWLGAVYPYYRDMSRQTVSARFLDPTNAGCVSRLSQGLNAGQVSRLHEMLGLGMGS
jgi:hypothetical protein